MIQHMSRFILALWLRAPNERHFHRGLAAVVSTTTPAPFQSRPERERVSSGACGDDAKRALGPPTSKLTQVVTAGVCFFRPSSSGSAPPSQICHRAARAFKTDKTDRGVPYAAYAGTPTADLCPRCGQHPRLRASRGTRPRAGAPGRLSPRLTDQRARSLPGTTLSSSGYHTRKLFIPERSQRKDQPVQGPRFRHPSAPPTTHSATAPPPPAGTGIQQPSACIRKQCRDIIGSTPLSFDMWRGAPQQLRDFPTATSSPPMVSSRIPPKSFDTSARTHSGDSSARNCALEWRDHRVLIHAP